MDHVAIMKKEWKLVDKILSGEKTVESRWYSTRRKPWNAIAKGDTVYFKEGLVRAKALVSDVLFFDDLDYNKIKNLINKYHEGLGISVEYAERVKDKKYCVLVFLAKAMPIEPFDIDKSGYGNMCAWLSVDRISKIKK